MLNIHTVSESSVSISECLSDHGPERDLPDGIARWSSFFNSRLKTHTASRPTV